MYLKIIYINARLFIQSTYMDASHITQLLGINAAKQYFITKVVYNKTAKYIT